MATSWVLLKVLTLSLASACGSSKRPPPKVVEEAADESWVTSDAGTKTTPEPEPAEPKVAKRPELLLKNQSVIEASVDYTGAVLVLGGSATLVVPEEAIPGGIAVHFGRAKNSRSGPARIGKVYELTPELSSAGAPFILELPLPRGVRKANFALSRIEEVNGVERLKWDVVPASRIEPEKNLAVLVTPQLPDGWFHLTRKAPTK